MRRLAFALAVASLTGVLLSSCLAAAQPLPTTSGELSLPEASTATSGTAQVVSGTAGPDVITIHQNVDGSLTVTRQRPSSDRGSRRRAEARRRRRSGKRRDHGRRERDRGPDDLRRCRQRRHRRSWLRHRLYRRRARQRHDHRRDRLATCSSAEPAATAHASRSRRPDGRRTWHRQYAGGSSSSSVFAQRGETLTSPGRRHDRLPRARKTRAATPPGTCCTSPAAPSFRQRVASDVTSLLSLPDGRKLLTALDNAGRAVSVTPTSAGNQTTILNSAAAFLKSRRQPRHRLGERRRPTTPRETTIESDTQAWQRRPPFVGLYHELVHALNAATGTMQPGKSAAGVLKLELQAIGLPFKGIAFRWSPQDAGERRQPAPSSRRTACAPSSASPAGRPTEPRRGGSRRAHWRVGPCVRAWSSGRRGGRGRGVSDGVGRRRR